MPRKPFERYEAIKLKAVAKGVPQLVLWWLAHYYNNKTGACFPSITRLSFDSGLNRTTIIRCIKLLEKWGDIKVVRYGSGFHNEYWLLYLNRDPLEAVSARDKWWNENGHDDDDSKR